MNVLTVIATLLLVQVVRASPMESLATRRSALTNELQLDYKCCNASAGSNDDFLAATGVHSLEDCREFCRSNRYGEPVYRFGAWACADITHMCQEVQHELCRDILDGESEYYYRYYAQQAFGLRRRTTRGELVNTGSSSITTIDQDAGGITKQVVGGIRRSSSDTASQIDSEIRSDVSQRFTETSTLAGTRNFVGTVPGGALNGVNLGRTGAAAVTERFTQATSRVDRKDTTQIDSENNDSSRRDITVNGERQRLASRQRQLRQVDGQDNTRTTTRRELTEGSAEVRGTATVQGDSALIRLGGAVGGGGSLQSDVRIDTATERSIVREQRDGARRTGTSNSGSDVRFIESPHGASLEERNTQRDGVEDRESTETAVVRQQSDRHRVTKPGLGSVAETRNRTVGASEGSTSTVATTAEREEISKSKECHSCKSEGSEVVQRTAVRDDIEGNRRDFNSTSVVSTTAAKDGPAVTLQAEKGFSTERQTLDRIEKGREISDRQSSGQVACKNGYGCKTNFNTRGSSATVSRNSSQEDTVIEVEETSVSGATFSRQY